MIVVCQRVGRGFDIDKQSNDVEIALLYLFISRSWKIRETNLNAVRHFWCASHTFSLHACHTVAT